MFATKQQRARENYERIEQAISTTIQALQAFAPDKEQAQQVAVYLQGFAEAIPVPASVEVAAQSTLPMPREFAGFKIEAHVQPCCPTCGGRHHQ